MRVISGKNVIKNILWLVFDKIFVLLVGLIVIVKIANHYGPSEYGLYEYALSINTLLGIIVLFVDARVVKKQFQDKNGGQIIYNTTIAKVILSVISLIIGIGVLLVIDRDLKFNTIFLLLLINNVVINLGFGIQTYFEYHLKSKNVVIAANIATFISLILQLIAIRLNFTIIGIVIIILLSSFIKLFILFYQLKISYELELTSRVDKSLVYSIIRESIPLAIAASAAIIYTRIDQVMIGTMLDITNVGIYSISSKMISVVAIVIGPVQISIFPKMIEWNNTNRDLYYKRYQALTSLTTWIYIIGIVITFFVAPILFIKFFSEAYMKSLDIFKIHVLGAFFMYNAALRSSHFTLNNQGKIMMISQIVAVVLNVILNYIMIPIIGVYGAAWATVITQFVSLFLSNLFFEESKEIFWLQLKAINPYYIIKSKKGVFIT